MKIIKIVIERVIDRTKYVDRQLPPPRPASDSDSGWLGVVVEILISLLVLVGFVYGGAVLYGAGYERIGALLMSIPIIVGMLPIVAALEKHEEEIAKGCFGLLFLGAMGVFLYFVIGSMLR